MDRTAPADPPVGHAAGGLVWRPGARRPLICVVHRQRYDDWSLPKGKLHPGEHPLAGAVREVAEETAVRARPQLRLPSVSYRVDGATKVVDYWAMSAVDRLPATSGSEVDELAWLPVPEAASRLSYNADRDLVHHWASSPLVSAVVLLVRHGYAGERGTWPGQDSERPLTSAGKAEAETLRALLGLFLPEALISASLRRCVQTVEPLSGTSGLPIEVDAVFDERSAAFAAAAARLARYARAYACTVVCTQGAVIPAVLNILRPSADGEDRDTAKGDGWLLPFAGSVPLAPTRLAVGPPATDRRPDRG